MKNVFPILQELISELERYGQTTSDLDLPAFAAWLHRRHEAPAPTGTLTPPHREPQYLNTLPPLVQLVPLVVRLDHFTHAAADHLLGDSPIAGMREFSVLALVSGGQTPTKSEIAADAQLELSTVTEVTRRLVQMGLVVEIADPKDRRARRLQMTPAGQAAYAQGRTRVEQLGQYLFNPLTATEQLELHRLLSILNAVHSAQSLPAAEPGASR